VNKKDKERSKNMAMIIKQEIIDTIFGNIELFTLVKKNL
jgi:hypothetical protein